MNKNSKPSKYKRITSFVVWLMIIVLIAGAVIGVISSLGIQF